MSAAPELSTRLGGIPAIIAFYSVSFVLSYVFIDFFSDVPSSSGTVLVGAHYLAAGVATASIVGAVALMFAMGNPFGSKHSHQLNAMWAAVAVSSILVFSNLRLATKTEPDAFTTECGSYSEQHGDNTASFCSNSGIIPVLSHFNREAAIQQVSWLSTHGIILHLLASLCGAFKHFYIILHATVWVMQILSAATLMLRRDSFGLYSVLVLWLAVTTLKTVLLYDLRQRTLGLSSAFSPQHSNRKQQTGDEKLSASTESSPAHIAALYVFPAFMLAIMVYVGSRLASAMGSLPDNIMSAIHITVDMLLLALAMFLMSDIVWKEQRAALQALVQQEERAAGAIAAQAAQRTFLRYICHELRVPLNGALMAAEELSQEYDHGSTLDSATAREDVSSILASITSLSKLLDDFLCYSKIEAGAFSLAPRLFNPLQMVHSSVALFAQQSRLNNINIQIALDKHAPARIWGDEQRLAQVLRNFLSNAHKFTPAGGHITVRMRCVTPAATITHAAPNSTPSLAHSAANSDGNTSSSAQLAQHWLEVSVSDSGIGISSADQCALFRPFSQLSLPSSAPASASLAKGNGTGLGLSISKHIVECSGGEIGCASVEGQGSTFYFRIPCARSNHQQHEALVQDEGHKPAAGDTACVADDSNGGNADTLMSPMVWQLLPSEGGGCGTPSSQSTVATLAPGGAPSLTSPCAGAQSGVTEEAFMPLDAGCAAVSDGTTPQSPKVSAGLPMTAGSCTTDSPSSSSMTDGTAEPSTASCSSVEDAAGALTLLSRVTIVDDIATNRRPIARLMKRLGVAEIHEAENGQSALLDAAWLDDELWLVDRNMPVMDGVTLVRNLRMRGYKGRIVGITGDALQEDQQHFMDAGLDAVLTKPCTHQMLTDLVKSMGFVFPNA